MIEKSKSGSIYKKSKNPSHADRYRISMDGNYIYNLKLPWYRKLWLMLDGLIFGLIYVILGLIFSWLINSYILQDVDKNLQKWVIGFQIAGDALLNVLVIYILLQSIPRIFPNIYPNPPGEHEYFRQFIGGVLLSFSILASEFRLVSKVGYVFGRESNLTKIINNFDSCGASRGFACGP